MRIKFFDIFNKGTPLTITCTLLISVRIKKLTIVPALFRDFNNGITTLLQILPEGIDVYCLWKTTRHANDRDRVTVNCGGAVLCTLT